MGLYMTKLRIFSGSTDSDSHKELQEEVQSYIDKIEKDGGKITDKTVHVEFNEHFMYSTIVITIWSESGNEK